MESVRSTAGMIIRGVARFDQHGENEEWDSGADLVGSWAGYMCGCWPSGRKKRSRVVGCNVNLSGDLRCRQKAKEDIPPCRYASMYSHALRFDGGDM